MSQEVFKQFMELIKPFMKSHGFTKKNNNFYKRHPQGNIGIINFQKDRCGSGTFKKVCQAAFLVQLNFQSIWKENIKLRHS